MKVVKLRKLGLMLVFGYLLFQTHLVWGGAPASIEQDRHSTSSLPQTDQPAAAGVRNDPLSTTEKLSLLVLGIGGVCLGLSICFSPKRAPQTQATAARLTNSCPLPHQVPRSWSEDIVPLKLKRSQEPSEPAS